MSERKHNWYVEIRPWNDDESDPGFLRMGPMSEHNAEKVDRGANINLNHEKYYTWMGQRQTVDAEVG